MALLVFHRQPYRQYLEGLNHILWLEYFQIQDRACIYAYQCKESLRLQIRRLCPKISFE